MKKYRAMLSPVRKDSLDARDYLFTATAQQTPPSADLRPSAGAVENQLATGSCTANATVSALELMTGSKLDFSRLFVYFNARKGTQFEGKDEGAMLRDAIKSASQSGVCLESTWPFEPTRVNDTPTDEAYREASTRKVLRYERIDAVGDEWPVLLGKLRDAVGVQRLPVVFSMPLGSRFMELGNIKTLGGMKYVYPTIMANPNTNKPIGGHAMLIVGYDNAMDGFIVENSWGAEWGAGGYCLIPYMTLTTEYFDFWVISEFAGSAPPAPITLTVAEVLEAYRDIGRFDVTETDEGVLYWSTHATNKREIYQSAAQFLQPALKAYKLLNGREYCD